MDASLILQVVTSPNAAFGRIGGRHLHQAAGVLAVSSLAGTLPLLPLASVPLPAEFYGNFDELGMPYDAPGLAWQALTSAAVGLISAAFFFLAGAALGGSRDWRRVFSVMLHVNVPVALVALLLAGPSFLVASELASLDMDLLEQAGESAEGLGPLLGYVSLMLAVGAGAAVWFTVLTVKAVKAAHGFGTAKSLGLALLVGAATVLAAYPLG